MYVRTAVALFVAIYFCAGRILQRSVIRGKYYGITVLATMWDVWATRHGRNDHVWLWQFNMRETFGIKFLDLPIEEYLFYLFSSIYIIFLWEGIKYGRSTESEAMLIALSFAGVWSLVAIGVPYLFRSRKDKLQR